MVSIYCDGSGSKAGMPIGYAIVVVEDDEVIETLAWGEMEGTSNTAELKAFIKALTYLKVNDIRFAKIYSDSQYICKGTNDYLETWRLKSFQFVKNDDLWRHINKLINKEDIKFRLKWIRGHQKDRSVDGVVYNNLADKLCGEERRKIIERNRQIVIRKPFL